MTAKTKTSPVSKVTAKPAKAAQVAEKPASRAVEQHRKSAKPPAKPAPAQAQKKPSAAPAPTAKAAPPKAEAAAPVATAKPVAKSPPIAKPAAVAAAGEARAAAAKPVDQALSKPAEAKPAEIRQLHEKPADQRAPLLSSISAVKPLPVPRITNGSPEPQRPRPFQSMAKSVPKISRFRELTFKPRFAYGEMAKLAEVSGTENGSELGFGFCRLVKARIPWTIKYDEVLFVIIGTLRVRTGGRTLELGPHDSIFLPAGTELVYEADDALVTYAIHPASAARMPST